MISHDHPPTIRFKSFLTEKNRIFSREIFPNVSASFPIEPDFLTPKTNHVRLPIFLLFCYLAIKRALGTTLC